VTREARAAIANGFEVDVFALREADEPTCEIVDGAMVYRMPVRHERGASLTGAVREYLAFLCLAWARVLGKHARRRYGVIQVHNPPDFLIWVGMLPKLLGSKLIFDIHDLAPDMFAMRYGHRRTLLRILHWIERQAANRADHVITVHRPYRDEIVRRGVRKPITVIMNSLDQGLLHDANRTNALSNLGAERRFVYHGTITPHYGLGLFVDAYARAFGSSGPTVDVYGDGDDLQNVEERVRLLGLQRRFTFSGGYLPQKDVLTQIVGASAGVVANLPIERNALILPAKLLEYAALEIPIVAPSLPTIQEHFSDEEVLYFEAGSEVDLARALEEIAENPGEARRRAIAAAARYVDYEWPSNAARYVGLLNDLVSS
jgi:glycosyltransferase involved in cell wall biosynthesis